MATCPQCGIHGYENDGTFTLEQWLQAQKLGEFSLSGVNMKFSAITRARLTCNACGWSVEGRIDAGGKTFIADPPS